MNDSVGGTAEVSAGTAKSSDQVQIDTRLPDRIDRSSKLKIQKQNVEVAPVRVNGFSILLGRQNDDERQASGAEAGRWSSG
jgi:hypothetical protein